MFLGAEKIPVPARGTIDTPIPTKLVSNTQQLWRGMLWKKSFPGVACNEGQGGRGSSTADLGLPRIS